MNNKKTALYEQIAHVNIACDVLGITNIERDAKLFVAQMVREQLKQTLTFAKKWGQRNARRKLIVADVTNAITTFQGSSLIKTPIPLIDTYNLGIDQLMMVPGGNFYAKARAEIDLPDNGGSIPESGLLPIIPRFKSYFLVTDGKPTKSAYNLNFLEDDEEDEEEFEKMIHLNEKFSDHSVKFSTSCSRLFREATKGAKTEQIVGLKPLTVEVLTVEQQLFMKDVITVCMGQDDKKRYEALQTLETDAGLQTLLPCLTQMVCKSIAANISQRCLSLIIYAGRILRAICQNKAVELSMVLHEILPALLSCMVGRNICLRPDTDNHWALRDYSMKTLIAVVRDKISRDHATEFKRRIFDFSWKVYSDPRSTAPMIYGTVAVLAEFAETEKIPWLIREFGEMISKHRQIQIEILNRGASGQLISTESNKLVQQLHKFEMGLRGKVTTKAGK